MLRRRLYWPAFALPGIIWLVLLFVLPLYVVLCLAFGSLDPIFLSPTPTWNPLQWDSTEFQYVFSHIFGADGFFGPADLAHDRVRLRGQRRVPGHRLPGRVLRRRGSAARARACSWPC